MAHAPLYEVYQRHLIFSCFYAQADTLEGQPLLLTSRSPHYYVSAAYWARDTLLWFFPALLKADRQRAREVLRAVFSRYAHWPGEHAQYLSGPPCIRALNLIKLRPMETVFARVAEEKHPSPTLYRTFLSPTDDPAKEPYLTYDNTLWAVALERRAPTGTTPRCSGSRSAPCVRPSTTRLNATGALPTGGDALMLLEQAPLDQGYACESFDAETAEARTGVGFAALAGLIANALASGKDHRPTL